jgi:hypothetical protein
MGSRDAIRMSTPGDKLTFAFSTGVQVSNLMICSLLHVYVCDPVGCRVALKHNELLENN